MKKVIKTALLSLSGLLVVTAGILSVVLTAGKKKDIYNVSWNGFENEIYIGTLKVIEYYSDGEHGVYIVPHSENEIAELIAESEHYVGEIQAKILGKSRFGHLFFKDNTYHFLYKEDGGYYLKALYSVYQEVGVVRVIFPSMGCAVIMGDTESEAYKALYGNIVTPNDMLFFDAGFESAAAFYERFDEYYAKVDYENRIIKIRGYDGSRCSDSLCVTLDFEKRALEFYHEVSGVTKTLT
jgi:hypothetical protein